VNVAQRREWREYVYGCPGLTLAQRVVLLALADFSDWPDGTNARSGVKRLAALCGFGTSVVEKALNRGRDLKLIHQTARANPKRGHAAVYRLVPVPDSTRTTVRIEEDSTRTTVRIEEDFNPYEHKFQPVREAVSTRTPVQPTKPLTPSPLTPSPKKSVREAQHPPAAADLVSLPNEPQSPPGKAKTAKTKAPTATLPDGWRPTGDQMQRLAAKYPALEVEWELDAFIEKAGGDGWIAANWYLRFCRWLRTGGCSSKKYRTQYANNDDKALGWLTVGLESRTHELPNAFLEGETA
jgi:hypothetical protein